MATQAGELVIRGSTSPCLLGPLIGGRILNIVE